MRMVLPGQYREEVDFEREYREDGHDCIHGNVSLTKTAIRKTLAGALPSCYYLMLYVYQILLMISDLA